MKNLFVLVCAICFTVFSVSVTAAAKSKVSKPKTPLMGWASWNQFGAKID